MTSTENGMMTQTADETNGTQHAEYGLSDIRGSIFRLGRNFINSVRALGVSGTIPCVYMGSGVGNTPGDRWYGREYEMFNCVLPYETGKFDIPPIYRDIPEKFRPKMKSYYRIAKDTREFCPTLPSWPENISNTDRPIICRPWNWYFGAYRIHVIEPGNMDLAEIERGIDNLLRPDEFVFSNKFPRSVLEKLALRIK